MAFNQFLTSLLSVARDIGIIIVLVTFIVEFGYSRYEEREIQSWQILTTKAPGNSGKIKALQYLNRGTQQRRNWLPRLPFTKMQSPLNGIELMPPTVAEQWKQPKVKRELEKGCTQFTYLRDIQLPGAILTDATFACSDLQKANLQRVDLRRVDLQRSDLRYVRLQHAELQWVNLQGANLRQAKMWKTDLRWANLQRANLQGAELWKASMQHANLQRATLLTAKLWMAELQWADLQQANLQGATLRRAKLQKANLRFADLTGADLREADLGLADLTGADLRKADLRLIKGVDCPKLKVAKSWGQTKRDNTLACGAPINPRFH